MFYIFIGYIFIFFHIKINGFDLLANFIGYAFVYAGLCRYTPHVNAFEKAKPWAIGMGIIFFVIGAAGVIGVNLPNLLAITVNLLTVLASLYLLFLIGKGVGELEQITNLNLYAEKFRSIWQMQAALTLGSTVLSMVPNETALLIGTAFTLAVIVANVVFLVQVYKAKNVLEMDGDKA